MMGLHQPQEALFSYRINLDHRLRPDHPVRRVAQLLDFTFVRAEVAQFYGDNGHEGVDPIILAKLMFLLFYDDVPSEREPLARLPERLDYLWFLGYSLEEVTPHHSVLSKARRHWGRTLQRHEPAVRVALGQQIARGAEARRDRRRRPWLMEGSFGRAANEHGFKRARWRRPWRQEIQDWR